MLSLRKQLKSLENLKMGFVV